MQVSLTHLRQNLFALADEVARTGEALLIERRGVRLKLVREDPVEVQSGRLQRLRDQQLTIGPALDPAESPAVWNSDGLPRTVLYAAEPPPEPAPATAGKRHAFAYRSPSVPHWLLYPGSCCEPMRQRCRKLDSAEVKYQLRLMST